MTATNKGMEKPVGGPIRVSDLNSFENVHTFDRRLEGAYTPSKYFSEDDRVAHFRRFIARAVDEDARHMVRALLEQTEAQHTELYDPVNEIDYGNLLCDLIMHPAYGELQSCVEEQLRDARRLGACPQGLSVRLVQIWRTLV